MDLKQQLKMKAENSKLRSRVNVLEKLFGQKENLKEEIFSAIKSKLLPLPAITAPKLTVKAGPSKRELVIMLNDMHYGLFVDKEEVNGLNSYGWKEASRRTAAMIEQALTFKLHNKNNISKIHLVINGDTIAGSIHGLTTKTIDLLTHQINGATHILSHVINALATNYPQVVVHGIVGNHEEISHKREGGARAVTEIFDNYSSQIYYSLSWIFKNYKNVSFNMSKGLFVSFDLPGGRVMVTHGHVLFSKELGNPGRNLNVKGLSDAIHRMNLGEIKKGRKPFKLVLLGHVHSACAFTSNDGCEVYIAPSLSGLDGYAASLGINHSFAAQVIFESVPDYIMGDSRLVQVSKADNRKELDKLIPVFSRKLKYE